VADRVPAGSSPLEPGLAALATAGRERGLPPLPAITPVAARERIVAGNRLCAAGPDLPSVEDVAIPVAGGQITLRIYRPKTEDGGALLYVHGGGWITGELGYADELCRFLARGAGATVVSVDYRLAPEHQFPVPLEDVWAALLWTAEHVAGDGPLGIVGDSAGGNLASACTLRARDRGGPGLAYQALLYPVVDSDLDRPSYVSCREAFPLGRADLVHCFDLYAPDAKARASAEVSTIRAASLAGLPPAVVVTAGHDPLHDEGRAYADRLTEAGVSVTLIEHPTLCHGFLRFTGASTASAAARDSLVSVIGTGFSARRNVLAVVPNGEQHR
jgi:acetyl esterase